MKSSSKVSGPLHNVGAFNQSRVKLYLRCRKAYDFRYDYPVRELGAKPGQELTKKHPALPLAKGSWMHELLEAHWQKQAGLKALDDRHPVGWKKRHKLLTAGFNRLFDEEKEKYGDLPGECERLFLGYLRRWADDDSQPIATLTDGRPAIEFVIEADLSKYGVDNPFKGRVDIMVEDHEYGGLWLRDAKWVRAVPSDDERMMSPQNIVYVWALRRLGYDVRGFIYDYGRTAAPTIPRILKRTTRYGPAGSVSLAKCDTTYDIYYQTMVEAHGEKGAAVMARTYYADKLSELKERDILWYHRHRIPVDGDRVKNGLREFIYACREIQRRKAPARTYLYNCRWNCDYHNLCVADFQGLDIDGMVRKQYEVKEETYKMEEVDGA